MPAEQDITPHIEEQQGFGNSAQFVGNMATFRDLLKLLTKLDLDEEVMNICDFLKNELQTIADF